MYIADTHVDAAGTIVRFNICKPVGRSRSAVQTCRLAKASAKIVVSHTLTCQLGLIPVQTVYSNRIGLV
jgi:hypothetical protein